MGEGGGELGGVCHSVCVSIFERVGQGDIGDSDGEEKGWMPQDL